MTRTEQLEEAIWALLRAFPVRDAEYDCTFCCRAPGEGTFILSGPPDHMAWLVVEHEPDCPWMAVHALLNISTIHFEQVHAWKQNIPAPTSRVSPWFGQHGDPT